MQGTPDAVRLIFGPAIRCIKEYLFPALRAIEMIALEEQTGAVVHKCRNARGQLVYTLSELEEEISLLQGSSLSEAQVKKLERLWNEAKRLTQFAPPQYYLGKRIGSTDAVGTLEELMPLFYCLPFDVACSVAQKWATATVSADWQTTPGERLEAVLLRAPLEDTARLIELLIGDADKHGEGEIKVQFSAIGRIDNRVEMTVQNRTSMSQQRGSGKSQKNVRELAASNRWEVMFPDVPTPGELYRVTVRFGRASALGKE
jgi:hypothetical protein